MVNFLSMFCPELQKLLKPIYDLTRKGRPFIWGKEQQESFDEIKCWLIKPLFLHMPNKMGRFHLLWYYIPNEHWLLKQSIDWLRKHSL